MAKNRPFGIVDTGCTAPLATQTARFRAGVEKSIGKLPGAAG
jgi:hypothetical protein